MTIFQKIIDGEIPSDKVYENDEILAFKDVNPQAPFHALVIPKKPIVSAATVSADDAPLVGRLLQVAAQIAREAGIEDGGYRIVTNIGEDGGQSVPHLHFHVLGGRPLGWPPG